MTTASLFATFSFDSGATFSPDRRYRYRLWRTWGERENRVVFVGLNPSKAGEVSSDQTITKEIGFAKRWGFTALDKVNLFGLVSTDPRGLLKTDDPVGPENDTAIVEALKGARRVVLAWGSYRPDIAVLVRARLVRAREALLRTRWMLFEGAVTGTLGWTRDGSPRHPSRLAYDTPFTPLETP